MYKLNNKKKKHKHCNCKVHLVNFRQAFIWIYFKHFTKQWDTLRLRCNLFVFRSHMFTVLSSPPLTRNCEVEFSATRVCFFWKQNHRCSTDENSEGLKRSCECFVLKCSLSTDPFCKFHHWHWWGLQAGHYQLVSYTAGTDNILIWLLSRLTKLCMCSTIYKTKKNFLIESWIHRLEQRTCITKITCGGAHFTCMHWNLLW